MAVEVKRKKSESTESLLRRFRQRVVQSGVQFRAKQVRYHEKPTSKTKKKQSALRRQDIKSKREYLRRIGKLPLEDNTRQSFTGKENQ